MQAELDTGEQTSVVDLKTTPSQFDKPPPIPALDDPTVYILHPDVMQMNTRKNYVLDQM